MAEPFSLAVGALAAFETILKVVISVKHGIHAARHFGEDAVRLLNRLNAQRVIAEGLKAFLFGDKSSAILRNQANECAEYRFRYLPEQYQIAINDWIRQSERVIDVKYQGLEKYGFVVLHADPVAAKPTVDGDEKTKQQSANIYSLSMWAIKDKRQAHRMVEEFAECIDLILKLVKTYLLVGCDAAQLRRMETDEEADPLGIAKGAKIRRIIAAEGVPQDITVVQIEDRGHLSGTKNVGTSALRAEVLDGEKLLVESLDYILDPRGKAGVPLVVQKRIDKLAALMQTDKPVEFLCLKSAGMIHQPAKQRFIFAYAYPPEQGATLFFSLSQVLEMRKAFQPSLDARLAFACLLAKAIQSLHLVGWVHKGLRSSNIVFFDANPLKDIRETSLRCPKLCGFEYARPLQDKSESTMETDLNVSRNVYRHPDRWGKPHEHFEMKHDLYSLGVILLEIGLWESVFSFQSSAFQDWSEEPARVKDRLLLHADRLSFQVGRRYRDIVLRCLGSPTLSSLDTIGVGDETEWENMMVDALSDICKAAQSDV